jgi:hypothetical protein
MKSLTLVLLALLISGCSVWDPFWDKEVVDKYAPETRRNQQRESLIQALNFYLDKPKVERVRIAGSPTSCTSQSPSVESCEWAWVSNSTNHSVAYTYGRSGLAEFWSYNGYFGQFTSTNHAVAKSVVGKPREADVPREKNWTHPSKTNSQLEQDTLQCRTEVQMYSRAVWDSEVEKCLQRNGWTPR